MGLTKKQKEVFDYICKYSDEHGIAPTQKEIKEYFNFKSFGSVQRYLKYLKDGGYLESEWNSKRGLQVKDQAQSMSESLELPLLGLVAAGNPIEAIENPSETIGVPPSMITTHNKRHFALRVSGESMIEDGILDGDIVFIKEQQNADNGQTVVAVVDGEATLKNLEKKSKEVILHPANSSMSPIRVGPDRHIKIVGVMVGLIRQY